MDTYEIEDTVSGVKLHVAGDAEPTQQDAHDLVLQELSDIATNLHEFPGGKFVLSVGPNQPVASVMDPYNKADAISKKWYEGRMKLIDSIPMSTLPGEPSSNYVTRLKSALSNYDKTNTPPTHVKGSYELMADKIPENTLTILAHGDRTPDSFETDWGHKFTLENIAKIMGSNSNKVHSIINGACYGAGCPPEKYKESFPNVIYIKHSNTNFPSFVSLKEEEAGNFIPQNQVEWSYAPGYGVDDTLNFPAWNMVTPQPSLH